MDDEPSSSQQGEHSDYHKHGRSSYQDRSASFLIWKLMSGDISCIKRLLLRSELYKTAARPELTASLHGMQQQPLEAAGVDLYVTRSKLQSSVALRRDEGPIIGNVVASVFTSDPPIIYLYPEDSHITSEMLLSPSYKVSRPTISPKMQGKSLFEKLLHVLGLAQIFQKTNTGLEHSSQGMFSTSPVTFLQERRRRIIRHVASSSAVSLQRQGPSTDEEDNEENLQNEREGLDNCYEHETDNVEIQKNTFMTECYSRTYKIKVDVRKTIQRTPQPLYPLPYCSDGEYFTEVASEKCEDNVPSPMFSDNWQNYIYLSTEGGMMETEGSYVVLHVPPGAVKVNTRVHAAVCANDVYIKHKLQLPASETIVSPLAEFWASTDFHFQKHVQITLPSCLSSNYDVDFCHVYCIRSEKPEGQITISELERLEELSETSEKEKPAAYFYVNGDGQVVVMTTHFSGYVCTSCLQCQNLSLEVYASHKHDRGEVRVFLRAELWDRLTLRGLKKCNSGNDSYRLVLRDTFQLKKMFIPAELLMELTVSNEQQNMWQHIKFQDVLSETRKTFRLNWDKIECKKCRNLQAIKYTELGPFCACWMLKSPDGATPSTLEVCVRVSHFQIQGHLEPDSSCAPIQIDVGPHTEDENRFSNGSHDRSTINIQNVLGDLHLAPQPSSTDED